jgi:predicted nucleic acid-binding protein
MSAALVVDASAAVSIVLGEPAGHDVADRLRRHLSDDGPIEVPDHFWLEVTNVLVRRYGYALEDVIDAIRLLDQFGMESSPIDRPVLLLALDRAIGHGLTVYDAAYLALAEAAEADLLTLDTDLAAAVGSRANLRQVRGTRRTSETRGTYGSRRRSNPWATHGQLLADLRRRATELAETRR